VKPIRNSAKAIIVRDGKILCIRGQDPSGHPSAVFYCLPGGGQMNGETLVEALIRECCEELSVEVTVGSLKHVREYIGDKYGDGRHGEDWHQIEFYFRCEIAPNAECVPGIEPDSYQMGLEWLPLHQLADYRFYPEALAPLLIYGETAPVYLGDVR
jgi:8-oxo-dGTP diphosphatase